MSRNFDALTTIPYNSTMQDLDELDTFSLMENEIKSNEDHSGDDDEAEDAFHAQLASDDHNFEEITTVSKLKNSHKKVLKSFREKYPMSMKIPQMPCFSSSSNSLNSFDDEDTCNSERNNPYATSRSNRRQEPFSKQDLNKIYQELNIIHNKLVVRVFSNQNHSLKLEIIYICFDYQDEYEILQEREDELKKRELRLKLDEERLIKLAQLDTKLRFEEIRLNYDVELNNLKVEFKEKFKENKRLHDAFKAVKQTNDSLKQQVILR